MLVTRDQPLRARSLPTQGGRSREKERDGESESPIHPRGAHKAERSRGEGGAHARARTHAQMRRHSKPSEFTLAFAYKCTRAGISALRLALRVLVMRHISRRINRRRESLLRDRATYPLRSSDRNRGVSLFLGACRAHRYASVVSPRTVATR